MFLTLYDLKILLNTAGNTKVPTTPQSAPRNNPVKNPILILLLLLLLQRYVIYSIIKNFWTKKCVNFSLFSVLCYNIDCYY